MTLSDRKSILPLSCSSHIKVQEYWFHNIVASDDDKYLDFQKNGWFLGESNALAIQYYANSRAEMIYYRSQESNYVGNIVRTFFCRLLFFFFLNVQSSLLHIIRSLSHFCEKHIEIHINIHKNIRTYKMIVYFKLINSGSVFLLAISQLDPFDF